MLERLEERSLLSVSIAVPGAQVALEDTAKVITGISFTSSQDPVTITLNVSHGVLTMSTAVTNGLTAAQVVGNGTAAVTISANVAIVNTTFANSSGLTYTPSANFNANSGSDSLAIHIGNGVDNADNAVAITIPAVNDSPSFALPENHNQIVAAIAPDLAKTFVGFASNLKTGPDDEVGQMLDFQVTTNNPALFTIAPAIDATTGTLTYTLAPLGPNASGVATVSVKLHDNGGTANNGSNTSAVQTFTITAFGPVNPIYNSVAGATLRAFVVNGVLTVQANGISFVSYPSAAIVSLTFNGGPKNDEIDLSGVTALLFPNLTSVKINGGAGNDRIVGSYVNDSIDGGSGNDTLSGGPGDDTLIGNAGTDLLVETVNGDLTLTDSSLTGGLGNDKLWTIENASLTSGDGGNTFDASMFSRGAVTLTGGAGDDSLIGGSKNDAITGRDGNDTLRGGDGNDTIVGGFGNDGLFGGLGNDVLIGGFGDDTIDGGDGRDTVVGGNGGAARGGDGVADAGDDLTANPANEINEAFKKLFAWE